MDEISKDARFAHISKDPRFRTMPKSQKKVKIDKRFKGMFSDKRFKMKYTVDKRGRPMNHTTNENLKKYYDLSESDSDSDEGFQNESSDEESALIAKLQKKTGKLSKKPNSKNHTPNRRGSKSVKEKPEMTGVTKIKKTMNVNETKPTQNTENIDENSVKKTSVDRNVKVKKKSTNFSSDSGDDSDELCESSDSSDSSLDPSPKIGDGEPDYARGEGLIESSTDEDDDDDDDDSDDDSLDHNWGELDKNVPAAEEISRRLAVCNMDWDRVRADDVFVLLNSFKPAGGMILSVCIYPSEFGVQRMKEEAMRGPTELKELAKEADASDGDSENEDTEGNKYHREKLRQYQLNRLKYYYAVVEFDSVDTANAVYEECDGMEYQTSAARIDLRFIPDDMTFDQNARSQCTSLPDASVYKPPSFFTSALCQTKVDLTWDETDQDRIKVTMKKYDKKGEVNEDDFKAYLASSSEDEIQDYGDLIEQSDDSVEESDEDKQIEKYKNLLKDIDSSSKNDDMEMEIDWDPNLKDATEDIIKNKEKSKEMTPWKLYQEKKKEKKKEKREERKKKRLADKEGVEVKTFSDDEIPDGIDMTDSFFVDELSGKSKSSKKKKGKKKSVEEDPERKKKEAELSLLLMDEQEDGRQHFNLGDLVEKKNKKKKKKQENVSKAEDDFKLDLKDSRFDAVFNSHLFNIDPSAPEFKKTKGMDAVIQEKLKRRALISESRDRKKVKVSEVSESAEDNLPKEQSLSSLLKSVKTKTEQFQSKKKKKK